MVRPVLRVAARLLAWIVLLAAPSGAAFGQAFIVPGTGVPPAKGSYVILADGTRLDGNVTSAGMFGSNVKWINFQADSGEKHKLQASEVKTLAVKVTKLVQMQLVTNALPQEKQGFDPFMIKAFSSVPWEEILKRDYLVYEQVVNPKNQNAVLTQILNPGFNSKLSVYQSMKLSMGSNDRPKSFLVARKGEDAILVERSRYAEQFGGLFGDCKGLMDAAARTPMTFDEFAQHVFLYDRACN